MPLISLISFSIALLGFLRIHSEIKLLQRFFKYKTQIQNPFQNQNPHKHSPTIATTKTLKLFPKSFFVAKLNAMDIKWYHDMTQNRKWESTKTTQNPKSANPRSTFLSFSLYAISIRSWKLGFSSQQTPKPPRAFLPAFENSELIQIVCAETNKNAARSHHQLLRERKCELQARRFCHINYTIEERLSFASIEVVVQLVAPSPFFSWCKRDDDDDNDDDDDDFLCKQQQGSKCIAKREEACKLQCNAPERCIKACLLLSSGF